MPKIAIFMLCIISAIPFAGKAITDTIIFTIDFPVSLKENKFSQRISYQTSLDTTLSIRINSFYYKTGSD
ncbi:MAG: hypothetical protein WC716_09550, partial [Chitinophagaceae bacterium]